MPATPSPFTSPSQSPSAAATDLPAADDARASQAEFVHGMAAYCTSFYTEQRKAEEAYPRPDPASRVAFARAAAAAARDTESTLAELRPPPRLAATFAEFVANAHQITVARSGMAAEVERSGSEGAAGDAFDDAIAARWSLAPALHAPGCDGLLPADQEEAAVAALRRFVTTKDSTLACRDLATPGFLQTRWFDLDDPLLGCVVTRDQQENSSAGLPRDITVEQVTGSDRIAATVHYSTVGGCECGDSVVGRLHWVDGGWLVSEFGS